MEQEEMKKHEANVDLTGIDEQNIKAFEYLCGPGPHDLNSFLWIGAICEGQAAAVAAFSEEGRDYFLEYLYVDPAFRRRGIGSSLIRSFASEARETGAQCIHVTFPDSREGFENFFLSLGGKRLRDGEVFEVPLGVFLSSDRLSRLLAKKPVSRAVKLSDASASMIRACRAEFEERDLFPEMLDDGHLSRDLSYFAVNDKDTVEGVLLCEEGWGRLIIKMLASFCDNPGIISDLFRALSASLPEKETEDRSLLFVAMDENAKRLAAGLAGVQLVNKGFIVSGMLMLS